MAFYSAAALSHSSFSSISYFPQTLTRRSRCRLSSTRLIKAAAAAAEPEEDKAATETKNAEGSGNAQPQATAAKAPPKKPVYSSEFL